MSDRAPMPPGERPAHPPLPDWLEPIRRGAVDITIEEATRFVPPEGSDTRRGAVLIFGHGPSGPDLLLTERAHDMRSHPGQVSFPGGSIDQQDASAAAAALREAEEETGVDPSGVEVFASLPRRGCRRTASRSPRCSPGGARRARSASWTRARCTPCCGSRSRRFARPPAPDLGAPPLRVEGPGLPDRGGQGPHPVGLHRRHHRPPLRLRRLDPALGRLADAGPAEHADGAPRGVEVARRCPTRTTERL